jgi:hypothetical protein
MRYEDSAAGRKPGQLKKISQFVASVLSIDAFAAHAITSLRMIPSCPLWFSPQAVTPTYLEEIHVD